MEDGGLVQVANPGAALESDFWVSSKPRELGLAVGGAQAEPTEFGSVTEGVSSYVLGLWIDLVSQAEGGSSSPVWPAAAEFTHLEFRVLSHLVQAGATVAGLARSLRISNSAVSSVAQRLMDRGAVVGYGDIRGCLTGYLAATAAGAELAADHRQWQVITLTTLLDRLEVARQAVLRCAMRELATVASAWDSVSQTEMPTEDSPAYLPRRAGRGVRSRGPIPGAEVSQCAISPPILAATGAARIFHSVGSAERLTRPDILGPTRAAAWTQLRTLLGGVAASLRPGPVPSANQAAPAAAGTRHARSSVWTPGLPVSRSVLERITPCAKSDHAVRGGAPCGGWRRVSAAIGGRTSGGRSGTAGLEFQEVEDVS